MQKNTGEIEMSSGSEPALGRGSSPEVDNVQLVLVFQDRREDVAQSRALIAGPGPGAGHRHLETLQAESLLRILHLSRLADRQRELVDAAIDEYEPACKEGEAEPASPHDDTLRADGARLDAEAFVSLLVSSSICLWGECHNIAERKRRQRQREEEEEYARNPPWWQFWKRGSGNDNEASKEPGGMTHSR